MVLRPGFLDLVRCPDNSVNAWCLVLWFAHKTPSSAPGTKHHEPRTKNPRTQELVVHVIVPHHALAACVIVCRFAPWSSSDLPLRLAGSALATQMRPKPPGAIYQGQAFTFNRIQDDIYHAVGTGTLSVGCNASIIVNADDVIVVDSHISPGGRLGAARGVEGDHAQSRCATSSTRIGTSTTCTATRSFRPDVEIIGHQFDARRHRRRQVEERRCRTSSSSAGCRIRSRS